MRVRSSAAVPTEVVASNVLARVVCAVGEFAVRVRHEPLSASPGLFPLDRRDGKKLEGELRDLLYIESEGER